MGDLILFGNVIHQGVYIIHIPAAKHPITAALCLTQNCLPDNLPAISGKSRVIKEVLILSKSSEGECMSAMTACYGPLSNTGNDYKMSKFYIHCVSNKVPTFKLSVTLSNLN